MWVKYSPVDFIFSDCYSACPLNAVYANAYYVICCYIDRWDSSDIFPRASSKGAHVSQSDVRTYPCAVVFTSPLTSGLCSKLQELQELLTSPLGIRSSLKSISLYLPLLLDRELNPGQGDTKLMLYHWDIRTPLPIPTKLAENATNGSILLAWKKGICLSLEGIYQFGPTAAVAA